MNVYSYLTKKGKKEKLVLATLIKTSGSTPQVSGASALFSEKGLVQGTIGGGILESTVIRQAVEATKSDRSKLLRFNLNSEITDENGAICGGSALVLIDAKPGIHQKAFSGLTDSLTADKKGLLVTTIRHLAGNGISIRREWVPEDNVLPESLAKALPGETVASVLKSGKTRLISKPEQEDESTVFIEPVLPVRKLLIVGGGHVGRALCHIASWSGFDVTVIDDRKEFARRDLLPGAKEVIYGSIEKTLKNFPVDHGTYIVIVTHAHINDANALRQCIRRGAAYIGMIGSRRKVRLIKDKFIKNNWADKAELDEIHAPVGLDIGSESVQEIAVSIAAELIMVSGSGSKARKGISIIILAAGSSTRMGAPKMLLPYGNSTIIETVVSKAIRSKADHVVVVTGDHGPGIREKLSQFFIDMIVNRDFESGMLSSVQAGLRAVPQNTKAAMILLGDQPMIKTEVIDQMIETYSGHAGRIVLPVYKRKRGHPLLVDMSLREEIESLDREKGLRQLLNRHSDEILEMEVNTSSILKDIDTKEDYEGMKELPGQTGDK